MEQPQPIQNNNPIAHALVGEDIYITGLCGAYRNEVVADLEKRLQKGIETYGVGLQPFNGRNALRDMYEELLDAVCYLRQDIYETNVKQGFIENKMGIYKNLLVMIADIRQKLGEPL